ncbi:MAG: DUF4384 domain-containing protein [Deltaproteobacteria bacterium]|nr:DUF4384 domain-containing protein [Deltaproteobacteria bacterium]MBW2047768.1 DUF4384 domain-containing protein [Deltaproteobacteria bacterium]MBW2351872.1 DUF4384 domain-containing protein [Deltaproteobacteria bacterium]HDZ91615.1 DUF4384 domain-containing protein [Deltaproteobacteria bacterium]
MQAGGVTLLYPSDRDRVQGKLMPGRLYTIPDDRDDFELEVEPPFGMDAVKVFATGVKIPIPVLTRRVETRSYRGDKRTRGAKRKEIQKELSAMKSINPRDLVDYYRGAARQAGARVFEDTVIVETRKK